MQQKTKKIPIRRCIGCNARRPKRELLRVVRSPQGELCIDATGKKSGRGAYLCPDTVCLAKARKAKRLERTFEAEIPPALYDNLQQEIEAAQKLAAEPLQRGSAPDA